MAEEEIIAESETSEELISWEEPTKSLLEDYEFKYYEIKKTNCLINCTFLNTQLNAQDMFKNGFYAPDLVLRYKKEINLS